MDATNGMALSTVVYPCVGGCGKPQPEEGVMCVECEDMARYYDAIEQVKSGPTLPTGSTAPESAHLGAVEDGAVEREPRRGLVRFLGWNRRGPAAEARLNAESATAAECGDPARRSELMARLPRVHAGVQTFAIQRRHLWYSDASLATVVVIVAWDAARAIWWAATDTLCLLVARHLRAHRQVQRWRLEAFALAVGIVLGVAASCAAWRLR